MGFNSAFKGLIQPNVNLPTYPPRLCDLVSNQESQATLCSTSVHGKTCLEAYRVVFIKHEKQVAWDENNDQ